MGREHAISTWQPADRPRERLWEKGAAALSDTELVALLLGSGTQGKTALALARELLIGLGGIQGLGKHVPAKLAAICGVGSAKAARVLAACELGRRRESRSDDVKICISKPEDAARIAAAHLRDRGQECMLALFLDVRNRLLQAEILSRGSLEQAPVAPRLVFQRALEYSSPVFILAHNHPSGDPAPSPADHELTRKLRRGACLLGLRLLDHIIVGDGSWVSLRAQGFIPEKEVVT